jgi:hypothetical protein
MAYGGTAAVLSMKPSDYKPSPHVGDVTGLQEAVTRLVSTGGKIFVGGAINCGSAGLSIAGMSGSLSLVIAGTGERAAELTYSGSGDFITVGTDDGAHTGAGAYNGTGPQLKMRDIRLTGPGSGTAARGLVDWENGSAVFERVLFGGWGTGYKGIGADVTSFRDCLFSSCDKGAFLASRCDQNTFWSCYFTQCAIGANVEYAWGARFNSCQFVWSTTADVAFDCPASATDSGDIRPDGAASIRDCWFESNTSPQTPRHIWVGRNGTSSRRFDGLSVSGGYVLASNTLNFIDVEASTIVRVRDVFQGGTLSGNFVNIVTVSGLNQEVMVDECHKSGGTLIGGTIGANQSMRQRIRGISDNAFAASFTPDALGGEIVQIGALTANITINAPTNPFMGMHLTFVFLQDGTGGRTVTWNAAFKTNWSDTGNTANKRSTIRFYYNNTNWIQVGAQSAYI